MKTTTTIRLILAVLTLAPLVAWAQTTPNPPGQISYQGFLTDASGIPLATNTPRNYTVTFRIYDASTGGNEKWAEQQVVTVDRGYFTVLLGNGSAIDSHFTNDLTGVFSGPTASDRYLGMSVAELGGNEIAPRLRLLASPYALLARNANALISPNGASLVTTANGQLTINGTITGNGSGLTSLNASRLTAGTVPDAQLSGNVARRAGGNNFTGNQTINASLAVGTTSLAGRLHVNGDFYLSAGSIGMDNGYTLQAKNTAGAYEPFLWPRYSDNATYLNYGAGGFYVRNHSSSLTMFLDNSGRVGIGTTAPSAPLHVVNSSWPSAIVQSSSTIGTWATLKNTSSGGNSWNLISSGSGNGEGAGKLLLNGGSTVMTLQANGRVGINTSSPGYPLEVASWQNYDLGGGFWYAFTSGSGIAGGGSHVNSISIKAAAGIQSGLGLYVTSDRRIKKNLTRSDPNKDLDILNHLKVTDYDYVDTVTYGNRHKKGFIAQEVEKVFPQAVSKHTDVVPDIYKQARCTNGWVELATNLKKGEQVRLIAAKSDGIHEVLEVAKGKFRTDFNPEGNELFVFGRQVNDFRALDYNAIGVLNVSATQELAKRIENLEARQNHLAELEQKAARVATLEREVAELKKIVAKLAEAGKGAKQTALASPPTAREAAHQGAFATTGFDR